MGLISWKIMIPSPEPMSASFKKKNQTEIENVWAFMESDN